MNEMLHSEILKYTTEDSMYNIIERNRKCIGVECDLDITNENNKKVGRILLIHYSEAVPENKKKKTLGLNLYVEFLESKIFWRSAKEGFYLIDPYFIKSYSPDPVIEVPIGVYKPKKNRIEVEMVYFNHKQYIENMLDKFFFKKKWPYKYVAAFQNFKRLFASPHYGYYDAINATIKHYWIPQTVLVDDILSKVDNEKKRINKIWRKYLNLKIQQDTSLAKLNNLKIENEKRLYNLDNVIKLRK